MSQRTSATEQVAEARVAFWTGVLELAKAMYRWGWRLRSWRVRDLLWSACGAALDRLIKADRELERLREECEDPARAQDAVQ